LLTALQPESAVPGDTDQDKGRAKVIDMLAHAVGAIMLSRACWDDSPLADEILQIGRTQILESLPA
jgi:TetR/AcrR family transcriptional repressor of nem operon